MTDWSKLEAEARAKPQMTIVATITITGPADYVSDLDASDVSGALLEGLTFPVGVSADAYISEANPDQIIPS